jgi:phosphate transport system permease protein
VVGFLVELLAAIPSVIFGLWGILYLVPLMRETVEPWVIDHVGDFPLFQGPPYGIGMASAVLILSVMIIPIVSSIARDVLNAVPREQREAAYALGATRWEVVCTASLPYAWSGVMGGVFLGLGRALGETMAVTMVIGNRPDIAASLFAPATTLASVVANEFAEATTDTYLSALMAVGFALLLVTLVVNGLARFLVMRTKREVEA